MLVLLSILCCWSYFLFSHICKCICFSKLYVALYFPFTSVLREPKNLVIRIYDIQNNNNNNTELDSYYHGSLLGVLNIKVVEIHFQVACFR